MERIPDHDRSTDARKIIRIVLWAALMLLSLTLVRKLLTSVETYRTVIESLDAKRGTAFSLITASTAVSAAITLIPGDIGTPIAQQIAEMSKYFIVVLGALYLEKYLLTILGFVSSALLVPSSCVLSVLHELRPGNGWKKRLAVTLLVVGIAGVLIVPASVGVSNSIDRTFQESIQGSLDAAVQAPEQIGSEAGTDSSLWSSLSSGASGALERAKAAVNHIIESVTILLVTDCVIPVAVALFFVWAVKTVVKAIYTKHAPPRDD